jgi:hypothetical protein
MHSVACTTDNVGGWAMATNTACLWNWVYNGVTYPACATIDEGKAWCPVELGNGNAYSSGSPLDPHYGTCNTDCPSEWKLSC